MTRETTEIKNETSDGFRHFLCPYADMQTVYSMVQKIFIPDLSTAYYIYKFRKLSCNYSVLVVHLKKRKETNDSNPNKKS